MHITAAAALAMKKERRRRNFICWNLVELKPCKNVYQPVGGI